MNEKKVVIVIVEGSSDENALGGILKEFFSAEEVQFKVVHGDITSDENTAVDNVVKKIEEMVDDVREKYGYRWDDFDRIIHIADTDGAFTKECIQKADVKNIRYYEDRIETSNVERIERRNAHKAEIMSKLYMTGNVHEIYYRMYFNSCNLEHVLYNQLKDYTDEEKERLSDDFSDKYEGKCREFIEYISEKRVAVSGSYKETWRFIEKGRNSLQRHSNMHLIFV